MAHLPPRSVASAEGETDLRLFPPPRAGGALRGQPAPVPISGGNAQRVVFGTLDILTGHRLFLVRHQQRGPDCQAFVEEIHARYRGGRGNVWLDEDSSHTAGDSQESAADLDVTSLGAAQAQPAPQPDGPLVAARQGGDECGSSI